MSEFIFQEVNIVVMSVLVGLFIRSIYDIFLIIRIVYSHKKWVEGLEDFTYWVFAGIFVFVKSFEYNSGQVRMYIMAGLLAGVIVYHFVFSPVVVKLLSLVLKTVSDFLKRIFKVVYKIFRRVKKLIQFFMIKKIIKPLKKSPKVVTITLKDQRTKREDGKKLRKRKE